VGALEEKMGNVVTLRGVARNSRLFRDACVPAERFGDDAVKVEGSPEVRKGELRQSEFGSRFPFYVKCGRAGS
jgi:hypothetical protein